jgi:hypothetical protein
MKTASEFLDGLEREGLVRRPGRKLSARFVKTVENIKSGHSVFEALLDERREG